MKKSILLYAYLTLCVLTVDTYILFPVLRSVAVFSVLFALCFMSSKQINIFRGKNKQTVLISYLFILALFVIDLIHHNDFQERIATTVVSLSYPIIFISLKSIPGNLKYIAYFFKLFVIYNGMFCILQMLGIYITGSMILSHTGFFGTSIEEFVGLSATQGLRTTGAYNSTIGFASIIGVATIFFFYTWRNKLMKNSFYFLCFSIFLLFTTQTRSALFTIIPTIYLVETIVVKKISVKRIFSTLLISLAFVLISSTAMPYLKVTYPRLFLSVEEDGSLVHRLQANVYGVVGTLNSSPVIGTPYSESLKSMDSGYDKLGLLFGDKYYDMVTHHNQPSYYFRYYGFIGLLLFFFLYIHLSKVILKKYNHIVISRLLIAILLFHFLYTLSHNNKLIGDYFIWIVLSLNYNYYKYENRVFAK